MTKKSPAANLKTAKKKTRASQESEKPADETTGTPAAASATDLKRLAHALGIHRLELERQNEELRRVQAEIAASHRKYADLYDFSPVGYFTFDQNGLIREVNHTGAEMLGMEKWSLNSMPFENFIKPDSHAMFRDHLAEAFRTRNRQTCEINLRGKNGVLFPVQLQSIGAESREGTIDSCHTAVSDISERKRAEEALRKSEERFRVAQELSLDAFTILDAVRDERGVIVDFRWVYVNPKAGQTLRRSPEELTGRRLLEVLPGNKANSDLFDRYVQVVETGEPNDYELHYQAEGIDGWFRNMTVKLRDGIAIYFNDITERKQAEEALRESELKLSALINAADESILLFGLDGTVLSANTTAARRIGMSVDEILGRKAVGLIPARLAKSRQKRVDEVIRTRKPVYFEDERAEIIFEHSIYPVQDKTGAISAIAIFSRDVTERRRAEEELRTTHAKLAQHAYELATVNRELESFSYTVSHDLKAPLRSIDGFARALQEEYSDNLDATGRDYLLRVITACRRMNQLIEAMLNMARLTRGELNEKTVDLSSLAMVIVHDLRKQQPDRQVEFVIADKLKVNGDGTMLQVLLENLFHNAWKFTGRQAAARIEFGTVRMDDRTVFFVRDNGAGFDMRYADKLFMPFNRFHAAADFPGLGIGLAIAHRIVRRHNGRLWAESAPEQGATFFFTL
jgi:PAS domain S-box-containing protein